jgi:hypothetical protein
MKNLTELTDKQIDKMAAAKRKLATKKYVEETYAQTSKNTRDFMNNPKPEPTEQLIKCRYMDLLVYTNHDGSNFFYIVKDGVEFYVNPTTLELEEVGQN